MQKPLSDDGVTRLTHEDHQAFFGYPDSPVDAREY